MLAYSNSQQYISVKLSAEHGKVFLSPLLMLLWDPVPMWNELSVSIVEENPQYLHLVGTFELINFGIQSLQYIGYSTTHQTNVFGYLSSTSPIVLIIFSLYQFIYFLKRTMILGRE